MLTHSEATTQPPRGEVARYWGAFTTSTARRQGGTSRHRYIEANAEQGRPADDAGARSLPGVELHPVDYEWYFTSACASALADTLAPSADTFLFMGAPTVATDGAFGGSRSVLIDRNPLLRTHWPDWPTHLRHVVHDLRVSLRARPRPFGVALFDAPWYPEAVLRWIQQASRLVQRNGLIAFALFPDTVRPTGASERRTVLEFARELGPVDVFFDALAYSTPLFELEALKAARLSPILEWRRADLVTVRNQFPFTGRLVTFAEREELWDTYVVGRQVIKLRRDAPNGGTPIMSIDGCPDDVLPTVSVRDPRRPQIDLWTSRNRVARVRHRRVVANLLDYFQTFGLSEPPSGMAATRLVATADRLRSLLLA